MATPTPPPKILVAVHGIGDQTAFATAQTLAFRFFDYYDQPPALPLGSFYPEPESPGAILLAPTWIPDVPGQFGFGEVYWAEVPRKLVEQRYTLEEAKSWARTIVARLQLRSKQERTQGFSQRQFHMLEQVLDEMIDAISVLENLTFLAAKAGAFTFNLKKLLDDYLNDVQVVTEFGGYRDKVVAAFDKVMTDIAAHSKMRGAEIYLVAHSEGSVVAFYSLLRGIAEQKSWVRQVRGLMTIGSPIETHVVLWRELWDDINHGGPIPDPPTKITWWNYYDSGDPIAYRLDHTRVWMRGGPNRWARFFEHDETRDVEFSRYWLPGKAHVDYWTDKGLFTHFIGNVMKPDPKKPPAGKEPPATKTPELPRVPGNRPWVPLVSACVPYLLVACLMIAAAFFLYKPINTALRTGKSPTSAQEMAVSVLGIGWLMIGFTAVVRIPRLTKGFGWLTASALLLLSGWWFWFNSSSPDLARTRGAINDALGGYSWLSFPPLLGATTLISIAWSHLWPSRGVRPLLVPGGLLALAVAIFLVKDAPPAAALWPVVLGSAAFLYVWWLATLLLDLTVIWHSYVRFSGAVQTMREMVPMNREGTAPGNRERPA